MEFFTRKELANHLGVHERTVGRWMGNGSLKGYKLGKGRTAALRIPKSEVKKFLEINNVSKK